MPSTCAAHHKSVCIQLHNITLSAFPAVIWQHCSNPRLIPHHPDLVRQSKHTFEPCCNCSNKPRVGLSSFQKSVPCTECHCVRNPCSAVPVSFGSQQVSQSDVHTTAAQVLEFLGNFAERNLSNKTMTFPRQLDVPDVAFHRTRADATINWSKRNDTKNGLDCPIVPC